MRSSATSARFRSTAETPANRFEWRPSRWPLAVLAALTVLAPFSLMVSEMPRGAAWPAALAAAVYGAWLVRCERARPPRMFVFAAGGTVLLDGDPIADVATTWRGPLAFVRWRGADGRMQRLAWWPDNLPPTRRRELRLAAPDPRAAPDAASMAP